MNLVLDWLVSKHEATSRKAWKQSTLVQSDSELNFQSNQLVIEYIQPSHFRPFYHCNSITKPIMFFESFIRKDKNITVFDLCVGKHKSGFPIFEKRSFTIHSESLFKSTFTLKSGLRTVQAFPIHRDQALSIEAFLTKIQ